MALGFPVGLSDGTALGMSDGMALGFDVGLSDGMADGISVGVAVGEADGFVEGDTDGLVEGEPDGLVDGDSVCIFTSVTVANSNETRPLTTTTPFVKDVLTFSRNAASSTSVARTVTVQLYGASASSVRVSQLFSSSSIASMGALEAATNASKRSFRNCVAL
jgi:hypothetical protein